MPFFNNLLPKRYQAGWEVTRIMALLVVMGKEVLEVGALWI